MERPDIKSFNHPREFLLACFNYQKADNPKFSVLFWSKQLGYNSPGYLSNVLNGKRKIQSTLIAKVSAQLKLDKSEIEMFTLLSKRQNSKNLDEKEMYGQILEQIYPRFRSNTLELDQFSLIRDWYHIPLLQLLDLANFNEDAKLISQLLDPKVPSQSIEFALNRLVRLGLAIRDKKTGKLKKNKQHPLFIGKDVKNEGIQQYHRAFIQKSLEALEKKSVTERDISATTLPIKLKDIPKLKEIIREFQQKLHQCASTEADTLYQINIQAFNLLTSEKGS